MQKKDLSMLHLSLGSFIRSEFGLCAGNNELMESCRSISEKDNLHEDDASPVIIKELWKRLKKVPDLKVVK